MVAAMLDWFGARRMGLARWMMAMAAFWALAGCALDTPERARATFETWAFPGEAVYFQSARACTVVVYRLDVMGLRAGLRTATDARAAKSMLAQGHAVAITDAAHSPDALSQAVMSIDLPLGLGMLSNFTGARPCMTDEVARGVQKLLLQPGVTLVYDPGQNALGLIDGPGKIAVMLRGTT